MQCNTKLLEAQILELQKVKAKAEKELEGERLLKEQKIKVILRADGEWIYILQFALLSVNVASGRVFINCAYFRTSSMLSLVTSLGLLLKA